MLLKLLRNRKINKKGLIPSVITSILLLALSVSAFINRQQIVDQISVWQYQPSDEIIQLADRSGMSETGRFIFYASNPKLDATQNFNDSCKRIESTVSILGCYDGVNIYLYDITNEELDGVKEVTAAHEMLHAVYKRLAESEKTRIDELLELEYDKLASNKDFTDLIEYYRRSEPDQRSNELHSIIGTEIEDISIELEEHYSKYFSDRQKVVMLQKKYSDVFKTLKNRSDVLSKQLNLLATQISSKSEKYNNDIKVLNSDISNFNIRTANGYFQTRYQFDTERNQLTVRIATLNSLRLEIQSNIDLYNRLYEEYKAIALESTELHNAIDSTLAPAPSL